ncbi:MAG TPA: energy transducer TonB [Opitutus sp.]|nr:energy transducer TonB [Opitutus sp.]
MVASLSVHVVLLFGFNRHRKVVRHVVVDDTPTITLVMPDLKDLEEPEQKISDGETPADVGITVPTLADVPTQVDLSTMFVQQIDFSTLVPQQDLAMAKTLAIPTHYNHGGKIGDGIKIFDIKDLDRPPEPLARIAPVFPPSLKQAGMQADVLVEFIVDPNGEVNNAFVVNSTDHRFDDASVMAIAKWKFRAGIKNGHRVNVRVRQLFPFRVTDDS